MDTTSSVLTAMLLYGVVLFGSRKYNNLPFGTCFFSMLVATAIFWLITVLNIESDTVHIVITLAAPFVSVAIVSVVEGMLENNQ